MGLSRLPKRQFAQKIMALNPENELLFLVSPGTAVYFSDIIALCTFKSRCVGVSNSIYVPIASLLISVVNLAQLGLFTLAFYHASQPVLLLSARSHE